MFSKRSASSSLRRSFVACAEVSATHTHRYMHRRWNRVACTSRAAASRCVSHVACAVLRVCVCVLCGRAAWACCVCDVSAWPCLISVPSTVCCMASCSSCVGGASASHLGLHLAHRGALLDQRSQRFLLLCAEHQLRAQTHGTRPTRSQRKSGCVRAQPTPQPHMPIDGRARTNAQARKSTGAHTAGRAPAHMHKYTMQVCARHLCSFCTRTLRSAQHPGKHAARRQGRA